jgi:zinc transport system substrate-binding protein
MDIARTVKNNYMKYFRILIGVGILVLTIIMVFPRAQKVPQESNRLKVVTTLFPLYDFAKNIGQDKVEVTLLLPPGMEAHSFEPKPSDIVKINESDLFLYTGKFMEPWAEDVIKGITNKNVTIVDMSSGIKLVKEEAHQEDSRNEENGDGEETKHEEERGHEHTGVDPHFWLDFNNAKTMLQTITMSLSKINADNAQYYQRNATIYQDEMTNLDGEYKEKLATCATRNIVYGGHYAFGYMARRYNLQYTAAQGFIPDSEPTAQDLIELVDQIREQDIRYVFYEELTSPKIAETLATETGAQLLLLNAAHNLSKTDFENDISFIAIMNNNLKNLQIGLSCSE